MISIIICSRDKTLLNTVSQSVNNTIGVPYEIIAIDNSDGKYGICKAYNLGAAQAHYDIFCFMHEDIAFVTQNWGQNVVNHLKDESVGLIGVMGAYPMLIVPFYPDLKTEANIIFVDVDTDVNTHSLETMSPNDDALIKETLGVDGTLMITRRNVYNQFKFDDVTLTAFHGYDVDFSVQVQSKYKVCVVFDVLLKHYFKGGPNKSYVIEMLKLTKKWKNILPLSIKPYNYTEYADLHWKGMPKFTESMVQFGFKSPYIISQFLYLSFNRFFKLIPFVLVVKNIIIPKIWVDFKDAINLKLVKTQYILL